jgi:hypothetical protein
MNIREFNRIFGSFDVTDQQLIRMLWNYGHFKNPDLPNAPNVNKVDVPTLTFQDQAVQEAVQSYQGYFKDTLDDLCLNDRSMKRYSTADGDAGPHTKMLIAIPRCGCPDYADREEANWPTACRGELTFAAVERLFNGLTQEQSLDVQDEMRRNWGGALADLKITIIGDTNTSKIWAGRRALPGGTLAWSYLARNSCNVRLEQAYDTTIDWPFILALTTMCHEVGHAIGLEHVNDSSALMYPSINSAARNRRGFPNQTDLRQCDRIGYEVSSDPKPLPKDDEPEPPTPEPPDGEIEILDGKVKLKHKGEIIHLKLIESAGL